MATVVFLSNEKLLSYDANAYHHCITQMVWTWERWNQEERHDLEKFERVVLALIDGIETLLLDMNFFVDE